MIARFRRKADTTPPRDQVAARYVPGELHMPAQLADLAEVARMADEAAELAEVELGARRVLLVSYMESCDDGPPRRDYEVVEAGDWLAYSPEHNFLYDASDGNWAQWYEQVLNEDGIPVVPVKRKDATHWAVDCPYCDREHIHSAAPGHRVAHCHRGDGYYLDHPADDDLTDQQP